MSNPSTSELQDTTSERRLIARAAAHQSWANTADRTARTANARDAFLAKFEDQVDPRRELTTVERSTRAASARRAYFTSLALRSARSRRQAAARRGALEELAEATMLLATATASEYSADEVGPPSTPVMDAAQPRGRVR